MIDWWISNFHDRHALLTSFRRECDVLSLFSDRGRAERYFNKIKRNRLVSRRSHVFSPVVDGTRRRVRERRTCSVSVWDSLDRVCVGIGVTSCRWSAPSLDSLMMRRRTGEKDWRSCECSEVNARRFRGERSRC